MIRCVEFGKGKEELEKNGEGWIALVLKNLAMTI